ncbi:hypothetical protein MTO96_044951, partial [Rhipicephalus appendiculatus]
MLDKYISLFFQMTNSDGEEVAVLLMDTQGIFDTESTRKESTVIFALSIMTSSVQIYNIMNNVNENHLDHLQCFADYGRLAQKGNGTKPFQKLLFLVRDWERPQNFEFGSRGGKSLINTRLEIKARGDAEQRSLRESIISCFSDIDGFLLPRPGDKTYVEVFKGGDLPEPESMLLKADELFDGFFKEEQEIITREQEVEAKMQEQRERDEQRKSEQILEKVKAEAKEAGWNKERELLKEQQTM